MKSDEVILCNRNAMLEKNKYFENICNSQPFEADFGIIIFGIGTFTLGTLKTCNHSA